jgi:predicted transcriptional regulator
MTPLEKLTTVGPQDEAMEVLSMLGRSEVNQLPVVENGVLLGLLRREDVVKWLALYGDSRERPSLRHRFAAGH